MTKSTIQQPADAAAPMSDKHGRTVNYLRLSVTDRCNLRCMYCWSCDSMQFIPHDSILRYEEIIKLVDLAVSMGVSKVRLTGGEPFIRKNFLYLVEQLLTRHPNLDLRITTNGTMLAGKAKALAELGVRYVNISLDTFNRGKFQQITGRDMLRNVSRGIDEVLTHGLGLKINAVALKGVNNDELGVFVNFAKNNPVDVRFIEFMPMGDCNRWTQENFWAAPDILKSARELVTLQDLGPGARKSGPAKLYAIESGLGRLGFITPMSNHFCTSCNRLRITPDGRLRTCLFSDKEYDLRKALRHPKLGISQVQKIINAANRSKPLGYEILRSMKHNTVADKRMNAIGG